MSMLIPDGITTYPEVLDLHAFMRIWLNVLHENSPPYRMCKLQNDQHDLENAIKSHTSIIDQYG